VSSRTTAPRRAQSRSSRWGGAGR